MPTCNCCGKTWRDAYDLNAHINSKKFTGEPRKKYTLGRHDYSCACGKKSEDSKDMRRHAKSCRYIKQSAPFPSGCVLILSFYRRRLDPKEEIIQL